MASSNGTDKFSLSTRNKYDEPPDGFKVNDIWPWIYNRRLSYIRKPIIQFQISDETYLMWGARNSYSSLEQLNQLIISTRYKTSHSSSEMESFIGKIVNIKGKFFENLVYKWVKSNYPLNINLKNEPIGPSKLFNNKDDLGDIDILTIDPNTSVMHSIECKNINIGRSPREIFNEIERFIGTEKNEKSWTNKHVKRDTWLRNNTKIISERFSLIDEPILRSIVLTSEEIPTGFLKEFPLVYTSFTRLKRELLNFLRS